MTTIELTQGMTAIVDDEDFERVSLHSWSYKKTGYAEAKINGEKVYLHRFIMNAKKGDEVDHKRTGFPDHGLDCQKENLRFCTRSQNAANSEKKTGASGYKGVEKVGIKWRASIRNNNKLIHLGMFWTPEDAARAYDKKAVELFGEFARTNF